MQTDASALLLMSKIATSFPFVSKQLVQLGVEAVLLKLKGGRPAELHTLIDSTYAAIVNSLSQV